MRNLLVKTHLLAVLLAGLGAMSQAQVTVRPTSEELNRPFGQTERKEFVEGICCSSENILSGNVVPLYWG